MWHKNVGTAFFRFVTNHAFDRQTDGRTAFSWLERVACNACSAVKCNVGPVFETQCMISLEWPQNHQDHPLQDPRESRQSFF